MEFPLLRVYAKFRLLIILFSMLALSSCAGGGFGSFGGFGSPGGTNTGVMSTDPNSIPNIGWQTPGQRQELPPKPGEAPAAAAATPEAKPEAPAATKEKIVVSILLPLSGPKSALGKSMLNAAQMALFDIGSPNFSLVPRDTKGTPAGAAAAAEAAVKAHSKLILGPIFADDVKAVKPVAEAAHIPVVSFTTDWTLAGNDTYIMGFLPFTQVMRVVKYAQDHGYGRLAVYAPQTEYCDVVISTLGRSSATVVRTARYPAAQHDVSLSIKEFATAAQSGDGFDFNALVLPIGSEGLRNVVTQLSANGITQKKVKFIGTGLWDDPAVLTNPAMFGGWFSAPDPTLRADFERRYQHNYGALPMRLSSLAYDATALAAVLARTATSPDEAYTSSTLTNTRGFSGIDGIFRFRSDGLSERGLAILELRSGSAKVIDPAPTAFIGNGT